MPRRHIALALPRRPCRHLWGVNFLAIHASLEQFPAIPPCVAHPLRDHRGANARTGYPNRPSRGGWLIGYGLGFGTVQFAFLYLGMAAGFPTGLSSLVLQASAPFTMILGAALLRERLTRRRVIGVSVATVGLVVVGLSYGESAPVLPFLLVLLGALGWAGATSRADSHRLPTPCTSCCG